MISMVTYISIIMLVVLILSGAMFVGGVLFLIYMDTKYENLLRTTNVIIALMILGCLYIVLITFFGRDI